MAGYVGGQVGVHKQLVETTLSVTSLPETGLTCRVTGEVGVLGSHGGTSMTVDGSFRQVG